MAVLKRIVQIAMRSLWIDKIDLNGSIAKRKNALKKRFGEQMDVFQLYWRPLFQISRSSKSFGGGENATLAIEMLFCNYGIENIRFGSRNCEIPILNMNAKHVFFVRFLLRLNSHFVEFRLLQCDNWITCANQNCAGIFFANFPERDSGQERGQRAVGRCDRDAGHFLRNFIFVSYATRKSTCTEMLRSHSRISSASNQHIPLSDVLHSR